MDGFILKQEASVAIRTTTTKLVQVRRSENEDIICTSTFTLGERGPPRG